MDSKKHLIAFLNRFKKPAINEFFANQLVVLDNRKFQNCEFLNCEIAYGGGRIRILDNDFGDCTFSTFGSAASTLVYLRGLYTSGAEALIENTLGIVRHAPAPPPKRPTAFSGNVH